MYGGGKKGPSKKEKEAAKQQQQQMQAAAAQQAANMQAQMAQQQRQFEEQQRQQREMLAKMEANKPAPGAQVAQGDTETDIRRQAAQRRGMRRSILAGESYQSPITTGSSTLG
jgi:hypothetical protein